MRLIEFIAAMAFLAMVALLMGSAPVEEFASETTEEVVNVKAVIDVDSIFDSDEPMETSSWATVQNIGYIHPVESGGCACHAVPIAGIASDSNNLTGNRVIETKHGDYPGLERGETHGDYLSDYVTRIAHHDPG